MYEQLFEQITEFVLQKITDYILKQPADFEGTTFFPDKKWLHETRELLILWHPISYVDTGTPHPA